MARARDAERTILYDVQGNGTPQAYQTLVSVGKRGPGSRYTILRVRPVRARDPWVRRFRLTVRWDGPADEGWSEYADWWLRWKPRRKGGQDAIRTERGAVSRL